MDCTYDDVMRPLHVGPGRTLTTIRELGRLAPDMLDGIHGSLAMAFRILGQGRDDVAVAEAVRTLLAGAGALRLELTCPSPPDLAKPAINPRLHLALLQLLRVADKPGDASCGLADAGQRQRGSSSTGGLPGVSYLELRSR